jgi:putative intracellular protease/amidase
MVVPFLLQTVLEERGAKHVAAADFESQVSVAERLVTGQNPASATRAAEEVVRLLRSA